MPSISGDSVYGTSSESSTRGTKKTWTAEFTDHGVHRRKSLKTTNRKIALQRASILAADLVAGTFTTAPPPRNISDSVELYLEHHETEKSRPGTIKTYRSALSSFRAFCTSQRIGRLYQVTPITLDGFRKDLGRGHEDRTVFNQAIVVKMFFAWCHSRRLVADNPLADYEPRMPPPKRKPIPTLAEVWSVLNSCPRALKTRLATLAFTGLRSGELRHRREEDINLESGWMDVVSREETHEDRDLASRVDPPCPR